MSLNNDLTTLRLFHKNVVAIFYVVVLQKKNTPKTKATPPLFPSVWLFDIPSNFALIRYFNN